MFVVVSCVSWFVCLGSRCSLAHLSLALLGEALEVFGTECEGFTFSPWRDRQDTWREVGAHRGVGR